MEARESRFIGLCLLLFCCQLIKIDAKEEVHSTSTWSEWSAKECSRTCGGGVRKSTRICMNNRSDGRHDCEGPSSKYTTCNTQDCQDRTDFRALQCAMFNEKAHEGQYYKWKPYYGDDADPCALVCSVNRTFHTRLAEKVVDGTRCRPDGYDICVNGKCKSAGCDRELGSTLKKDACLVCGGEGKDCKTMKGIYENKNINGYKDIITIFKGATNIRIQEKGNTKNYFAIRDKIGNFYLNSKWELSENKKFIAAGTMFHYKKDSNGQYLIARGPTTDSLTLVLVGKGEDAKISYEYYIAEKGHTSKPVQRVHLRQPKSSETEVKSFLNRSRLTRQRKSRTRNRSARNRHSSSEETPLPSGDAPPGWNPRRSTAQYQWQHGSWTACSGNCGEGTQRRAVQCFDMEQRVESKGKCPEESKPRSIQKCEVECDSSFKWVEAGWTECSQSCDGGEMSMILVCEEISTSGSKRVKERYCEESLGGSPRQMKVCNEHQCPESAESVEAPCWGTLYGCCQDRQTAASGPDYAGCGERRADCHNTDYGCCPDGVNAAEGPSYAGCPSLRTNQVPETEPTLASITANGNICFMKQETGSCGDYKIRWSYNATTGRCDQFWYGGCGGNDNRFEDRQQCLDACRGQRTSSIYPTPTATSGSRTRLREVNLCELKSETGPCQDYVIKWFFNISSRRCEQFWYGGCRGNDNRFDSDRDCQENCRRGIVSSCISAPFGCCEDGVTAARGPQGLGCPINDCRRSQYGCCPDGVTASGGYEQEGCARQDCNLSQYGCCQDGVSFARGNNYRGCRSRRCEESPYGCCPDGVSYAQGSNYAGCRVKNECERTEYGCCPDQTTVAQGPNGEGCCHYTEFGCCPDGLTISGPNHEGCRTQNCRRSRYGCCRDGFNFARGVNFKGCPSADCRTSEAGCCPDGVTFVSEGCAPPDCHSTTYGCCPDGRTIARGYYHEGCREKDCRLSRYGCCQDRVSYAKGEDYAGCPTCHETKHGCCPDGITVARGVDYYGCAKVSCHVSDFGCCPDMVTAALGPEHLGCKEKDCRKYVYGCCPDGVTYARGKSKDPCPTQERACASTRFGCCGDGKTAAEGPERYGCPETLCINSRYGCCEDGVTFARGRNFDGCPDRRIRECASTRFGCCEDGRTAAEGPERYGCPETLCINSRYGCCEDGVTFARGRNFDGCPDRRIRECASTRFGCCEDGRTAAEGPERYGCPETLCINSRYGCCEDGVTFARGRNFDGCPDRRIRECASTRFGCCEDRRTAAEGPDRYGCPETQCALSDYGCCPDGRTFARGYRHEGCQRRDCSYSRYGCCPDGVSFSLGENFVGCEIELGCEASTYGCCPDRVTAARGPNYAGCPSVGCGETRYGCCPDGITPADGPNEAGCGCKASRFGCCPDHINAARGPDYAGCVIPTPNSQVDCESEMDPGSCFEYVTRWFFNVTSSRCEQFWYGGCGGNNNRFDNENECTRNCRRRRPSPTTAAPLDPCRLPYDEGTCSSSNPVKRWYYEEFSRSCQVFWYSGCDGNENNFESESSCVQRCFLHDSPETVTLAPTEPPLSRDPLEICHLELQAGVCSKELLSWHYDKQDGLCKNFTYSGCYGNSNRFSSKEGCEAVCSQEAVCNMKEAYGTCQSNIQRYRYDTERGDCVAFRYSGCNGNANNFVTMDACRTKCGVVVQPPDTTTDYEVETTTPTGLAACSLEKDESVCPDGTGRSEIAWYYDLTLAACQKFNYSGCGGNNNRFVSAEDCTRTCNARDVCTLPKDSGTCYAYSQQYYFNQNTKRCEIFVYGGCGGNANRYPSIKRCEKTCHALMEKQISTGPVKLPDEFKVAILVCHLQPEKGPCEKDQKKWYYEIKEARCRQFTYGGCEGNKNLFETKEKCENLCSPEVVCSFSRDSGNCTPYHRGYYFNSALARCEHLAYGDCYGNANRFYTIELCEKTCRALITTPEITTPTPEPTVKSTVIDCHLPKASGSCRARISAWHYDIQDNTCKQFYYGGCEGNANRFETKDECEKTCNAYDICNLPKEGGHCLAYMEQYYFDQNTQRCEQFVYGGCGGNANRFASLEKCHIICRDLIEKPVTSHPPASRPPPRPVEMCHLEKKTGSCRAQISAWYYDMEDNTCKHFYYGGCEGNGNRFQSREECESICNSNDICQLPKEFGICYAYSEQYYFNTETKRCEDFVYGGCGGNANRFSSLAKCLALCHSLIEQTTTQPTTGERIVFANPVEVCHLEKDVGPCRSQIPAWHYDATEHQCKQFYYGGCQGNANKFDSKEECQSKCDARSICQLPKKSGQCYAYSDQYYFNSRTKRCEQFVYGGCGGNANRFSSAAKCMDVCQSLIKRETLPTPPVTDTPLSHPVEACHLEKEVGPCRAQLSVWYYDAVEHQCKEFKYGGCQGNANRFGTKEQCHLTCHPQGICHLPKESGQCYAYSDQYYFNPRTKRCEQFVYGGCGGNANRFTSAAKCMEVCQSYTEKETLPTSPVTDKPLSHPVEACHLEKEVGPCRAQLSVWYYDAVEHQCKEFKYGGCQGNANRFGTKEQCHLTCHPQVVCYLPKESGQCYAYSEQYYFNPRTKRCEQFSYGGCGGNANRFSSAAKCIEVCESHIVSETPPRPPVTDKPLSHPVEACHLEREVGPCRAQLSVWYYDAVEHQCKEFKYGGCQGNANRFGTKEQCHLTCHPQDICELPKKTGHCLAYSEQYYFNSRTKRCEQFVYGGCGGNANRFSSAAKCMDVCQSLLNIDIPLSTHQPHINPELCQLPQDSGNCFNYSEIYYFDQETNRCEQFVYTGCGGNANRFQSLSECQRVCRPVEGTKKPVTKIDVPETPKRNKEVCRLRKLIGPCSYNITAWYFDDKYRVCSMFVYSGCGGNKNNFKTLKECEKVCQPTNDVCNHPMAAKPCSSSKEFWVYDNANKTCRHFPTGHCEENPLQFISEHACQKQCLHQGKETKDVCHFPMKEGRCRSYIRVWYYNMDDGICKPFIYGGCEGNKNRFDLKEKCERICNKHTICKLKKDSGLCYGYNDAYYFNPKKNMCEHFVYGGCGGNANRFSSRKQCHEFCGGHISNGSHATELREADKCRLEPDSGPCQERNIFWYYDYKIGVCSRFFYTGCGGNENRFASEEICLTSCKPFMTFTTYAPLTQNSLTGNHNNKFRTIHVTPKETLTLQCGELFDSTGGGNQVTWTHEGQDISPSVHRQIQKLNLVVYNVSNKDTGMYTCRKKSNTVTPTLDKYQVIIKVPATIEYGASHMTALPNHRLAVPCQAHGVPKPLITWYKSGQQIHNDNHYRVFDNGTLLIDPFISSDVATYKCLARNDYEGKAEKEVIVTIQESLNLEIKKSSRNLHVGDKVTLTCTADGYPNTRFQWFYKDRELYSNNRITVTDGILIIRNATYDNTGIYTCRGTHANEQVNKDVSVRILSMPDEVPNVCVDRLPIDRCRMIIAAKLCKRKTFHKNCCVTCSRSMTFRR